MLRKVSSLNKSSIMASDGEIGQVDDVCFDDETWSVRYLVVDTGTWLTSRKVLISQFSIVQPFADGDAIHVALSRDQVSKSPDIDTHKTVSRQHEREYLDYYGYPIYWNGGGLWTLDELNVVPPMAPPDYAARNKQFKEKSNPEDAHLRSIDAVTGYHIEASDGSIGHVDEFIFDTETWEIRYLVVDTSNWWPASKKVLIGSNWIEHFDWLGQKASTALSRESIKNSPLYDDRPCSNATLKYVCMLLRGVRVTGNRII